MKRNQCILPSFITSQATQNPSSIQALLVYRRGQWQISSSRACLSTSSAGWRACICVLIPCVIPWFYQFVFHHLSFNQIRPLLYHPPSKGWLMQNWQKQSWVPVDFMTSRVSLSCLTHQPYLISTCSYSAPLWAFKQTYSLLSTSS